MHFLLTSRDPVSMFQSHLKDQNVEVFTQPASIFSTLCDFRLVLHFNCSQNNSITYIYCAHKWQQDQMNLRILSQYIFVKLSVCSFASERAYRITPKAHLALLLTGQGWVPRKELWKWTCLKQHFPIVVSQWFEIHKDRKPGRIIQNQLCIVYK